jgi:predicted acyl esterase
VLPVQHGMGDRGWRSNINGDWVSGPSTLSPEELASNRREWRHDSRVNRLASDEFWRSRLPDFSQITTPLLSAANWGGQGLHLRGNVEGFLAARSPDKWLDFHTFEHWTEYYTSSGIALQKRFFAYFLADEDNGWGEEPRVQMVVRHPSSSPSRRAATDWPLPETSWTRLYLEPAELRLTEVPPFSGTTRSVRFGAMSDGLTFLTPPLPEEIQIIGPLAAKLFVSSSTEDADVFLILRLFTPDLKEVTFSGSNDPHTPLAHGWLRASHRKLDPALSLPYRPYHAHDEIKPLRPGHVYELDIEIWPTCIVAPPGYRLGLSVRGNDYEYPGDLSGQSVIGQPAKGVGPFRHVDAEDRPSRTFDNEITLHFTASAPPYLLLPFINLPA